MIVGKKGIASNVERLARYHRPEQRNENNAPSGTVTLLVKFGNVVAIAPFWCPSTANSGFW